MIDVNHKVFFVIAVVCILSFLVSWYLVYNSVLIRSKDSFGK